MWQQLVPWIVTFVTIANGDSLQLTRRIEWESYSEPGDLVLGGVFPVHKYDKAGKLCSDTLLGTVQTQFVHAMAFGVREINRRTDLLPNLTLGFVIFDDCTSDAVALARATSFLPRTAGDLSSSSSCPRKPETNSTQAMNEFSPESATTEAGGRPTSQLTTEASVVNRTTSVAPEAAEAASSGAAEVSSAVPHHDVAAVLGSIRSQNTLLMAELLGLFQVCTQRTSE